MVSKVRVTIQSVIYTCKQPFRGYIDVNKFLGTWCQMHSFIKIILNHFEAMKSTSRRGIILIVYLFARQDHILAFVTEKN